ncbi:MAG TPA: methylamine utilization protein MauJ [Verrucomicrobiae bacterium]|nr:methylamine utilization protein MauJ [Verrucomicrobiae bacterium]
MQSKKLWMVTGVETNIGWPIVETTAEFRGHQIILRPQTDKLAPSVAMAYEPPVTAHDAQVILNEFLSALSWVERSGIKDTGLIGGSHPFGIGKGPIANPVNPRFAVHYLPDPQELKTRLALALYREAMNVNSTPYTFLGFYKIINILHRNPNEQKKWINRVVELLDDYYAKERVAALKSLGHDIGAYLYESGRNAVAHAFSEPSIAPVNPDEPDHVTRLSSDLPVVRALAEYLIEKEFGVLSKHTIWRQHLYELNGFRAILGDAVIDSLKRKERVPLESLPRLPNLSIRLKHHKPFPVFENLQPNIIEGDGGGLLVACASLDNRVRAGLFLNFTDERLQFDPIGSVVIADDGSQNAVRRMIDRLMFVKALYLNGELEVWDAARNSILGRCDAFIPRNVDIGRMVKEIDDRLIAFDIEATGREKTP